MKCSATPWRPAALLAVSALTLAAGCGQSPGDDDASGDDDATGDTPTPTDETPTPEGSSPTPVAWELAWSDVPYDRSPEVSSGDLAELVAGNTAFAVDLYQAYRGDGSENLFFSPYSISIALAMTYGGARHDTEAQMAGTLHYTLEQAKLHPAFNALGLELASRSVAQPEDDGDRFQLRIANAVWGQVGFPFEQPYLDLLAESYGSGLRLLDFAHAPEPSRQVINGWVADQTNDRIEDLIPEGAITDLTRLVLANAIYFSASWLEPFIEELTGDADFTLSDGSVVRVPTMQLRTDFPYAVGEGWQAIELPYVGEELSMVVILPEAEGLEGFEDGLEAPDLEAIVDALSPSDVQLTLPKFGFETRLSALAPTLGELGMPDAIDPFKADFSGMSPDPGLYITSVEHMAFVAVDEAGTEAAAATAVVIGDESAPEPVKVDRPFLFLIRDRVTDAVLFMGRVSNPLE